MTFHYEPQLFHENYHFPFSYYLQYFNLVMSGTINTRTRNPGLQRCLDQWSIQLTDINSQPADPQSRYRAIDSFARSFVPLDVEEADIAHYAQSLASDLVCFDSEFSAFSVLNSSFLQLVN